MRILKTNRYVIAQAPPMGGPPGAPGAMPPPPPAPSKYLLLNVGKNKSGEWGAYFSEKLTGKHYFVKENRIRELAVKYEKKKTPDAEIAKTLARIEGSKLNEENATNDFKFTY